MAQPMDERRPRRSQPSPGTMAAKAVRGTGAGTADLVEELGSAGVAALAGSVRSLTRAWGHIVGMTIDGAVAAAGPRRRRGTRDGRGGAPGARRCIDLTGLRTREEVDEALARGLAAHGTGDGRGREGVSNGDARTTPQVR